MPPPRLTGPRPSVLGRGARMDLSSSSARARSMDACRRRHPAQVRQERPFAIDPRAVGGNRHLHDRPRGRARHDLGAGGGGLDRRRRCGCRPWHERRAEGSPARRVGRFIGRQVDRALQHGGLAKGTQIASGAPWFSATQDRLAEARPEIRPRSLWPRSLQQAHPHQGLMPQSGSEVVEISRAAPFVSMAQQDGVLQRASDERRQAERFRQS
jgi:hypothetical protein